MFETTPMISFEELSESVYEDLNGQIIAVHAVENAYRVVFECDDWCKRDNRRRFELSFEDVRESTVSPSDCGSFHVADEHPLLWDHNDEHASMFFSSAPQEPTELVGLLYEAHTRLLAGWRELADYLHAGTERLGVGYGLLAEGPRQVISEYANIIGDRLRYTIIQGHKPFGGYRVVLFDECYVVCRNVSAIELELDT
jgi:hypothetical protein